jgi:hypothetical protein
MPPRCCTSPSRAPPSSHSVECLFPYQWDQQKESTKLQEVYKRRGSISATSPTRPSCTPRRHTSLRNVLGRVDKWIPNWVQPEFQPTQPSEKKSPIKPIIRKAVSQPVLQTENQQIITRNSAAKTPVIGQSTSDDCRHTKQSSPRSKKNSRHRDTSCREQTSRSKSKKQSIESTSGHERKKKSKKRNGSSIEKNRSVSATNVYDNNNAFLEMDMSSKERTDYGMMLQRNGSVEARLETPAPRRRTTKKTETRSSKLDLGPLSPSIQKHNYATSANGSNFHWWDLSFRSDDTGLAAVAGNDTCIPKKFELSKNSSEHLSQRDSDSVCTPEESETGKPHKLACQSNLPVSQLLPLRKQISFSGISTETSLYEVASSDESTMEGQSTVHEKCTNRKLNDLTRKDAVVASANPGQTKAVLRVNGEMSHDLVYAPGQGRACCDNRGVTDMHPSSSIKQLNTDKKSVSDLQEQMQISSRASPRREFLSGRNRAIRTPKVTLASSDPRTEHPNAFDELRTPCPLTNVVIEWTAADFALGDGPVAHSAKVTTASKGLFDSEERECHSILSDSFDDESWVSWFSIDPELDDCASSITFLVDGENVHIGRRVRTIPTDSQSNH